MPSDTSLPPIIVIDGPFRSRYTHKSTTLSQFSCAREAH